MKVLVVAIAVIVALTVAVKIFKIGIVFGICLLTSIIEDGINKGYISSDVEINGDLSDLCTRNNAELEELFWKNFRDIKESAKK